MGDSPDIANARSAYDEIGKTKDVPSSVLQHEANNPEESNKDVRNSDSIRWLENGQKHITLLLERERDDKKRIEEQEDKIQELEKALKREREEGKKAIEDLKKLNKKSEVDINTHWMEYLDTQKESEEQTERWYSKQIKQLSTENLRKESNLLVAKGLIKDWKNAIKESSEDIQKHDEILRNIEQLEKELNIEVHVQEVEPSFKKHLINQIEKDDVYNMQSFRKGTVVLINGMNFWELSKLSMRTGSELDEWMLKQLFSELGFEVFSHRNPKKKELLDIVHEACIEIGNASASSFILVVLSHGTEGAIYAADGQKVLLNDLKAQISETLGLGGKPKMLIINSCLGDKKTVNCLPVPDPDEEEPNTDPAALIKSMPEVPTTLLDSCPISNDDQSTEDRRQQVPETANVITAYSTVHGYVSHRDEGGSLFIQNLVLVFAEHSHNTTVSEMLRKVRERMAEHPTKPQVPQTESTLLKQWYLMPGMHL